MKTLRVVSNNQGTARHIQGEPDADQGQPKTEQGQLETKQRKPGIDQKIHGQTRDSRRQIKTAMDKPGTAGRNRQGQLEDRMSAPLLLDPMQGHMTKEMKDVCKKL